MRQCGSRLLYRRITDESGEETWVLTRWWICGTQGCPTCQLWKWAESDLSLQIAFPRLEESHLNARWLSLVLPYPPTPVSDLRDGIDRMNRGLDRLRQRKTWPGSGHLKMVRVEILPGGLCQIEIHLLVMMCACHSRTLEIPSPDDWTDEEQIRRVVQRQAAAGVDYIKLSKRRLSGGLRLLDRTDERGPASCRYRHRTVDS